KRKRKPAPGGQQGQGGGGHQRPAGAAGGQGAPNTGVGTPTGNGGGGYQNRPQGQGGGGHHRPAGNQDNKGGRPPHRRGQRLPPKVEPTEKEIRDQIKATLARLSGAGKSGKFAQRSKLRGQKRDRASATAEEAALEQELQSKILKVTEFVTANELANMMDVSVTEIISTCMSLGMFVSINQRL